MTDASKHRKRQTQRDIVATLSAKEALVLELLLENPSKEMYGLEMVSGSRNRLKRGTVYVTLDRMEDKGYITSRQEAPKPNVSGIPRRLYRVTGYGQKAFEIWQMAKNLSQTRLADIGGAS